MISQMQIEKKSTQITIRPKLVKLSRLQSWYNGHFYLY